MGAIIYFLFGVVIHESIDIQKLHQNFMQKSNFSLPCIKKNQLESFNKQKSFLFMMACIVIQKKKNTDNLCKISDQEYMLNTENCGTEKKELLIQNGNLTSERTHKKARKIKKIIETKNKTKKSFIQNNINYITHEENSDEYVYQAITPVFKKKRQK